VVKIMVGLCALGAIATTYFLLFDPTAREERQLKTAMVTHSLPQESVSDLQKARLVYIRHAQSFANACDVTIDPHYCYYDPSFWDAKITPLGEQQLPQAAAIINQLSV
jgi:hypothetical protein